MALTDQQVDLLLRCMPWGIVDPILYGGESKNEKDNYRKIHKRLVEKGLIETRSITCDGRSIKRDCITEKGLQLLAEAQTVPAVLRDAMLLSSSIRAGKNAKTTMRYIRYADSQVYLSFAGIDTVFSTIIKSYNPYVFGFPEVPAQQLTLADNLSVAMSKYVWRSDFPSVRDSDLILFLPKACNALSGVGNRTSVYFKYASDYLGFIINNKAKMIFAVYKSPDRKSFVWRDAVQESLQRCMSNALLKRGYHNITHSGKMNEAIILCETKGEYVSKALNYRDAQRPYDHVVLHLTKREKLPELKSIVQHGTVTSRKQEAFDFRKKHPNVSLTGPDDPPMYDLKFGGQYIYVGFTVDLVVLCSMQDSIANDGIIPYILCYDWQAQIYQNIGVPTECIFVIAEKDYKR